MKPSRDTGPQTVNYRPRTLSSKPKGTTMLSSIFGNLSKMWGAGIGTAAGQFLVKLIEGQFGDVMNGEVEAAVVVVVAAAFTYFFPANKPKPAA